MPLMPSMQPGDAPQAYAKKAGGTGGLDKDPCLQVPVARLEAETAFLLCQCSQRIAQVWEVAHKSKVIITPHVSLAVIRRSRSNSFGSSLWLQVGRRTPVDGQRISEGNCGKG